MVKPKHESDHYSLMHLLPTDIIVRRYKQEHSLWISQRLLIATCGMSEEYLRARARPMFKERTRGYKYKSYLPDTGASWRWARVNGEFYYDYARISDRAPTYFRSALGSEDTLLQAAEQYCLAKHEQSLAQTRKTIRERVLALVSNEDTHHYRYQMGVGFTAQQALQMATARAWCRFIVQQLQGNTFRKLGIAKIKDFYQVCTDILMPLNLEGFCIGSAKYLRDKVAGYPAGESLQAQREYFVSGKYGNTNALVVGKYPLVNEETGQVYQFDIHQAIMYRLYMNPGSPTKEYIHQLWDSYYKHDIISFGEQPVSYRAFCHHLRRFNKDILMGKARHGIEYYKKNMLTYVTTERLQYAHSLFAGDGSGTIAYKYRDKEGKQKVRNLYITVIHDVASHYIAGWSAGPEGTSAETADMTIDALKMAVKNGDNQTMFEFVSDNHTSFTSEAPREMLNMIFNRVRTIEVGNSQANPAETEFRLFKRTLKNCFNMLSTSRDGGIETKSNPDHISIQELPSYADAVVQIHDAIKRYNTTPMQDGSTPEQRFKGNKHPKCEAIEPQRTRYLFGKHTKVNLGYMRGYVNVYTSSGYHDTKQYQFEIPDYGGAGTELIAKYTGYTSSPDVRVVWDEEMADLYSLDGSYILSCPRAQNAIQSHAESDDGHAAALEHHIARKNLQLKYADAFGELLDEINEELNYEHTMALGGNKESYNETIEEHASTRIKESARRRVDRDFNESGWADNQ